MIRTGTLEAAQSNRRHLRLANGTGYWRSDLIGAHPGEAEAPQAFLVEQDADTVILPHFHERDQFQVVVEGGGTLGRHEVRPVSVHYAGRHTGYGPITANERGLWYFSLRALTDPGAHFLPQERDRMQHLPKLNLLAEPVGKAGPATEEIIAPRADGVAAWMLRVPSGARMAPPAHPGGGRFYIVIDGELHVGAERLPKLGAAFVSADETAFDLQAGTAGVQALALQYAGS